MGSLGCSDQGAHHLKAVGLPVAVVKLSRRSCGSENSIVSATAQLCGSNRHWIPAFAGMTEMRVSHRFNAVELPVVRNLCIDG